MERGGSVYIMTNKRNSVLYTGVTSNLINRIYEHRMHLFPNSFTDKYNCTKLVWYCYFDRIEEAIAHEKRIKAGRRDYKIKLVEEKNPDWNDLWDEIKEWQ